MVPGIKRACLVDRHLYHSLITMSKYPVAVNAIGSTFLLWFHLLNWVTGPDIIERYTSSPFELPRAQLRYGVT